jgi:hypothetical protein
MEEAEPDEEMSYRRRKFKGNMMQWVEEKAGKSGSIIKVFLFFIISGILCDLRLNVLTISKLYLVSQ